jgi:broad specificity phosphatase PhoE
VIDDLAEWDYGDYEGLTSAEIRDERPGWVIWDDGPAGGETLGEVSARADRVIARLRDEPDDAGHSLVFAHGHLLRVLAARWAGLQPTWAKALFLDPATVSVLGYEREIPAIRSWNADGAGR